MGESKIGDLSIYGNLQAGVIRYGGDYTACRLIHYNLKLLGSMGGPKLKDRISPREAKSN